MIFPSGVFRHMGCLFCSSGRFCECSSGVGYCCVVSFGDNSSEIVEHFVWRGGFLVCFSWHGGLETEAISGKLKKGEILRCMFLMDRFERRA